MVLQGAQWFFLDTGKHFKPVHISKSSNGNPKLPDPVRNVDRQRKVGGDRAHSGNCKSLNPVIMKSFTLMFTGYSRNNFRYSLIVLLMLISNFIAAQTINLDVLLNLHHQENPGSVAEFLLSDNAWRGDTVFTGGNYKWINAAPGESVEVTTRDKVSYNSPSGLEHPVLIYATSSPATIDSLLASAQGSLAPDSLIKDTELVKVYRFSGTTQTVIIIKPLEAPPGQTLRYACMIYSTEDYTEE